jgi:hypothetical protein
MASVTIVVSVANLRASRRMMNLAGDYPSGRRRLVLRQGFLLGAGVVVIGLAAAAGLTHLLESLLFGVAAIDTATFGAVAAALTAVAALAALVPAHRAPKPAREAGRSRWRPPAGRRRDGQSPDTRRCPEGL